MPPRRRRRQEDNRGSPRPNREDYGGSGGGGSGGGGGGGKRKKPLGVPEDYAPPVPQDGREYRWKNGFLEVKVNGKWRIQSGANKGQTYKVMELYRAGDEWKLAPKGRQETLDLQEQLVYAGLLDPDKLALEAGSWGNATRNAFKELLSESNTTGRPWSETLGQRAATLEELGLDPTGGGGAYGGGGEERPPLQVELTDPSTLAARGSEVAGGLDQEFGTIGRGMTDEEKMQFAESYQNQERMIQTDQYNRGGEPGEFVAGSEQGPPTPEIAAEEWLKKNRPGEYAGTNAAKAAKVWFDLLENSKWRLSSG